MDLLRLAEAQGVEFALLGHTVGHSIQFRVFWQCTPQTLTKPIMCRCLSSVGKMHPVQCILYPVS